MKSVRLAALAFPAILVLGYCAIAASNGKDQDLLNQGRVLIFEKKFDQAYNAFQRLVQEFPNSILSSQA